LARLLRMGGFRVLGLSSVAVPISSGTAGLNFCTKGVKGLVGVSTLGVLRFAQNDSLGSYGSA
jgi:hypothetical protein